MIIYTNVSTEENTYYYRIRAANSSGVSDHSNVITILPLIGPPIALEATNITKYSFTANWTSVVGAANYKIDIATDSEFINVLNGYNNLTVSGTSIDVTGLESGKVYFYRLRSMNSSGTSGNSNIIDVVTLKDDYNYVREFVPIQPMSNISVDNYQNDHNAQEIRIHTQYIGGLGQVVQEVDWRASADSDPKDIIKPIVYDDFKRQPVEYLPYVSTEKNGEYNYLPVGRGVEQNFNDPFSPTINNSYINSPQYQFYNNNVNSNEDKIVNDNYPYSETIFEKSPLNRVLNQGFPGEDWQPSSGNTQDSEYLINDSNEVIRWELDAEGIPQVLENDDLGNNRVYFPGKTLFKNITCDEEGNRRVEYIDKQGNLILEKVELVEGAHDNVHEGWICTYYIYDNFGDLRYIFQPELVKNVLEEIAAGYVVTEQQLDALAFQYQYDGRHRLTIKKDPGAEPEYLVYNERDQLVLTQNEIGRASCRERVCHRV